MKRSPLSLSSNKDIISSCSQSRLWTGLAGSRPWAKAHGTQGAILFLAVGAIAVLSILALGATSSVMQELRLAKFVTEGETSSYLAASAIEAMKILLANDETPDAIILYDLRDRDFVLGDRNIHIHCVDEQGRINVDVAPKDVLARLPGLSGSPALVDAIYAAHVEVKEDLFLCNGMTEEIYGQLKELVTACGLGVVNINTASPEVFSAQGMDADLIRKIQQYRAGDDGQEGTPDDKYFSKPADIIAILAAYNLAPAQLQTLQYLLSSAQLGTTSNHVALEITVKKGLKKERFFRIVMDPASGKVASWSEE